MIDLDAITARLAEWQRLRGKTTPGTWDMMVDEQRSRESDYHVVEITTTKSTAHEVITDIIGIGDTWESCETLSAEQRTQTLADARFIVYAHNAPIEEDMKALIAEVKKLT